MKQFKTPDRIVEKGVNVRPRSAIKLEDPLDLPFEERPGVWVYYLMPFYEDPDRGYYRRLSSEAETLGKIVFRAECSACFWRLNHPLGSCAAFPDGIPRDIESHLFPVPGDSGICYLGQYEAGLMGIPEGIQLEESRKLMKKVIKERKRKSGGSI